MASTNNSEQDSQHPQTPEPSSTSQPDPSQTKPPLNGFGAFTDEENRAHGAAIVKALKDGLREHGVK